ncbi:MAG TPA: response regulator, partial [Nannocystaceae bacterium]|nr:response regulator [Nannocystaceae bacterium]
MRLRVLIIEDDPDDETLLLRQLTRSYAVDHLRVETASALAAALDGERWDLVISDYSLPTMDAPRALAMVRERGLDVPFIIVSGTVDEVTAVASMRAGAHDFLDKAKLARLLPAVERELREAASRNERRKMQEQLLFADRMVSLGTLAAGVAHEINNPLAAVLANVEVVLVNLGDALDRYEAAGAPTAADEGAAAVANLAKQVQWSLEALDECREASLRVRDVSRDLKLFSRAEERRASACDVRRVLDSSLRMARNEIKHRANVVRDYEDVPLVAANESRLGQVFLNLLVNAAHAIQEGSAPHHEIRVTARQLGHATVVVEVHDTGPGIPADVLPRIFDPFYTTKPAGIGTGLGLAICRRLIAETGGDITVETSPTTGTTFRVTLPVAADVHGVEAPAIVTAPSATRRAKILVIDDDQLVLNAAARVLAAHHDVTATTRADEALTRMANGEWFDVVLCDVLMPNMTGMAFFEELKRLGGAQAERVVFMTGGAFTPAAREFLESTKQ